MWTDLLVLDGPPRPFDEDVVAPAAFAVHVDPDALILQRSGKGRARALGVFVRVEDFGLPRGATAAIPNRFTHRVK